jgi:hypothetical protein
MALLQAGLQTGDIGRDRIAEWQVGQMLFPSAAIFDDIGCEVKAESMTQPGISAIIVPIG